MRKSILVAAICLFVVTASFSGGKYQPLNVKTGLWQVAQHTVSKGLPPQMAAMANHSTTYKTCVTTANLKENPFSDEKCKWTVVKSDSSDMEVKGTDCEMGRNEGMSTDVHYKLHVVDSEHVTGSGDWTAAGQGQSMSGTITGSGHWVAASCGNVQ